MTAKRMTMDRARYIPNNHEHLLREQDPQAQLIESLTRVVRSCPPQNPWTSDFKKEPRGLWTGPTSLAYLFFRLDKEYPDLVVEGHKPVQWLARYLDCGSEDIKTPRGGADWGVKNEFFAYNAVKAAATQDFNYVSRLVDAVQHEFECPPGDNEFLSGRAGILALLRFVKRWLPESGDRISPCTEALIRDMLSAVPWRFHGHNYIGAAHGVIGIVTQLILSDHRLGGDPAIEAILDEQLSLQASDGHWFITDDPTLGSGDLVHFCHGSPGFVISLMAVEPFVNAEIRTRIKRAVQLGRQETWSKGLLTKEPNLCHGISGNMLALEGQEQREHFMAHATFEKIDRGLANGEFIKGDDGSGLQWGEAGRAWSWLAICTGRPLGFPGYNDMQL